MKKELWTDNRIEHYAEGDAHVSSALYAMRGEYEAEREESKSMSAHQARDLAQKWADNEGMKLDDALRGLIVEAKDMTGDEEDVRVACTLFRIKAAIAIDFQLSAIMLNET